MMKRRFMNNSNEVFDCLNYLTIEALEEGLQVKIMADVEYHLKLGSWKPLPKGVISPIINTGETISFRARLTPDSNGIGNFIISKKCELKGNCMSMIFGDDAKNNHSLDGYTNVFSFLFSNCTTIQSVSENFLPATTLANKCYDGMFKGCTRLINAPELPATTLASYCYSSMFYGCTSLVNTPELPAATLVSSCYRNMFYGCSTLNYIKMLATDISASDCLYDWVNGVSPTGTFVKNKDATWDVRGESGIPNDWTIITE